MQTIIIEIEFKFNNTCSHQSDALKKGVRQKEKEAEMSVALKTKTRKGDQARESLKAAAIRLLNRCGYHQIRVKDVTVEAGVATGLFYHYFKNLDALVREVMDEHMAQFEATNEIEKDVTRGAWLERMKSHYRLVVKTYAEQPGLMRCIKQYAADDPEFRARWHASYNKRMQLLVEAFPRVMPDAQLSKREIQLLVLGLGGIGQNFLDEYYIEGNPELVAHEYTQEELSEWLAALFYRGFFAANPSDASLDLASPLMSVKRKVL